MEINQLKNIHSWIRSTEISEIVFVSALILPIYLLSYNYALVQINEEWKYFGLIFAVLIYILGIIWMKTSQSSNEKNLRDITIIKNYILDKDFSFMSFDKLEELDSKYTQDRVKQLMYAFPNDIRLAKLKNKKKGIKVLNVEVEIENT